MIGPDHFHANFYDVMPPFVLGVEEAVAFGDFGTRSGPLPVARDLAWSIRDGLTADGFDLSLSYALTVDHGVVQTYDMLGVDVPLVPLVVNTAAPPLPAMDRCVRLGAAVGAAIRAAACGGRVLVAASGGLSHWLPTNDPRDAAMPGERRAMVIHGRRDVHAVAAAREPRVRAMGGDPNHRVPLRVDPGVRVAAHGADPRLAGGRERLARRGRPWISDRPALAGHRGSRGSLDGSQCDRPPLAAMSTRPSPRRRADRVAERPPSATQRSIGGQRRRGGVDHERHQRDGRAGSMS